MTLDRRPMVVDASVAIRYARHETGWEHTRDQLLSPALRRPRLLVPSVFWLEVANVLARRYRLAPENILETIADVDALELETIDHDRPMLLLTLDAVGRHGLSAYDAAYLAVAEWADADRLTADARLSDAAGDRALFVGDQPHAVSEGPASYGTTWADWPGAAAYLRQLRTRVTSPR